MFAVKAEIIIPRAPGLVQGWQQLADADATAVQLKWTSVGPLLVCSRTPSWLSGEDFVTVPGKQAGSEQ